MPKFKMNFADVPSNNVPDGEYDATLESVEMRQSQNSEFPYLNWKFVLSEGESSGRTVYMTTGLGPKSLWNVRDQFVMLGFPEDAAVEIDVDDETNMVVDPPLSAVPVKVSVFNETYNNRQTPKVSHIVQSYAKLDIDGPESVSDVAPTADSSKTKKPKLL